MPLTNMETDSMPSATHASFASLPVETLARILQLADAHLDLATVNKHFARAMLLISTPLSFSGIRYGSVHPLITTRRGMTMLRIASDLHVKMDCRQRETTLQLTINPASSIVQPTTLRLTCPPCGFRSVTSMLAHQAIDLNVASVRHLSIDSGQCRCEGLYLDHTADNFAALLGSRRSVTHLTLFSSDNWDQNGWEWSRSLIIPQMPTGLRKLTIGMETHLPPDRIPEFILTAARFVGEVPSLQEVDLRLCVMDTQMDALLKHLPTSNITKLHMLCDAEYVVASLLDTLREHMCIKALEFPWLREKHLPLLPSNITSLRLYQITWPQLQDLRARLSDGSFLPLLQTLHLGISPADTNVAPDPDVRDRLLKNIGEPCLRRGITLIWET